MPRSVGIVRAWVRLYTRGLPADLWEQAHESPADSAPSLTTLLLSRWLLGLPDDLLWRAAHLRSKDVNSKEGPMVQSKDYKAPTVIGGVFAAVALGWLLVNAVLGEVSYQRQTDVAYYIGQGVMFSFYAPVAIAAIGGGFLFMRKAPMLCALLVTTGSAALGILLFWLVILELAAIGLSVYAYCRAGRLQAGE